MPGTGIVEVESIGDLALHRGHCHHSLDQIAEIMIPFAVLEDFDQPPVA